MSELYDEASCALAGGLTIADENEMNEAQDTGQPLVDWMSGYLDHVHSGSCPDCFGTWTGGAWDD